MVKRNELAIHENLDQPFTYDIDVSKDLFQSSINDENENASADDPDGHPFDQDPNLILDNSQTNLDDVNIEIGAHSNTAKLGPGIRQSEEPESDENA